MKPVAASNVPREASELLDITRAYWRLVRDAQGHAAILGACKPGKPCAHALTYAAPTLPAPRAVTPCGKKAEDDYRAYIQYVSGVAASYMGIVPPRIEPVHTGGVTHLETDACYRRLFVCRFRRNVCWANKVADALGLGDENETGNYARPLLDASTCEVFVDSDERLGDRLCHSP